MSNFFFILDKISRTQVLRITVFCSDDTRRNSSLHDFHNATYRWLRYVRAAFSTAAEETEGIEAGGRREEGSTLRFLGMVSSGLERP